MADISQINLPDDANNPYDLKDSTLPHSSESAVSGGTTLSLVTTGEKYNWNRINNVLPGYHVTALKLSNTEDVAITNKAGKVYVSENKDLYVRKDVIQNITTLTAVFGFSYVTNNTDSSAIWIGIQSAQILANGALEINYILYKHSSATVKSVQHVFLVIGTA